MANRIVLNETSYFGPVLMVCVDPNDIPSIAVVDPEFMLSMPKGLTASTGMGCPNPCD